MGTKILPCSLFILLIQYAAFSQQRPFAISGSIGGWNIPAVVYLRYTAEGKAVKDSCLLNNGRFRFKGNTAIPAFASLLLSRDGRGLTWPYDELMFYIDTSVIRIESKDSASNALVKGAAVNADYAIYKAMKNSLNMPDSLWTMEKEWSVSEQFIKAHPSSFISASLIRGLSNSAATMQEVMRLEEMFAGLSPVLKAGKEGQKQAQSFVRKKRLMEGMPAPDFSQPDTSGNRVTLSSFRGKPVLLHFWASWCKPCRKENKELLKIYRQYHAKGFEIISVSVDNIREKWLKAIKEDGIYWVHLSDLKGKNAAADEYEIHSFPTSFLIDRDGKIVARNVHGDGLINELSRLLSTTPVTPLRE